MLVRSIVIAITATNALALNFAFNLPAIAEDIVFFCGKNKNGLFVTYGRTDRGNIPLFIWTNTPVTTSYPPQKRCSIMSQRLQNNYKDGTLNFIKVGRIHQLAVLCGASNPDDACTRKTFLLILNRQTDRCKVLQRLSNGIGLPQPNDFNRCPDYFDLNIYLKNASVDENLSPDSPNTKE